MAMSPQNPPGKNQKPEPAAEQPLIEHLLELRNRLLRVVLGVIVCLVPLLPFAQEIFGLLADPLLAVMPEGTSLIATQVASPFLTPFKLALLLSLVVSMPWTLWQIWAFVAPGLYAHERRFAVPLLASSTILFYLGMAFAYFVVFPLIFGFFVSVASLEAIAACSASCAHTALMYCAFERQGEASSNTFRMSAS